MKKKLMKESALASEMRSAARKKSKKMKHADEKQDMKMIKAKVKKSCMKY